MHTVSADELRQFDPHALLQLQHEFILANAYSCDQQYGVVYTVPLVLTSKLFCMVVTANIMCQ
jgi:hypothetical protein